MTAIDFKLNEPQIVKLADPVPDREGCLLVFRTEDGRCLELPKGAARQIAELKVSAGEEISIGRYRQSELEPAEWIVSLTPRTEQARAAKEAESEIYLKLADSVRAAEMRKGIKEVMPTVPDAIRESVVSGVVLKPTGTDGPAPQPRVKPQSLAKSGPPVRVSYRLALRDITQTVTALLKDTGEQWNDQAKQDAICTIFISAAKTGGIVFDFDAEVSR